MSRYPSIALLLQLKAALEEMGRILDRIDADIEASSLHLRDGWEGY